LDRPNPLLTSSTASADFIVAPQYCYLSNHPRSGFFLASIKYYSLGVLLTGSWPRLFSTIQMKQNPPRFADFIDHLNYNNQGVNAAFEGKNSSKTHRKNLITHKKVVTR